MGLYDQYTDVFNSDRRRYLFQRIKENSQTWIMDSFMGFSVHMDFEGQKLAERLFQIIVVTFGAVGWLYGYYVQDFFMTVLTLGAGFVLGCLVTLPPWPIYRRYPLKWA